ncbi:hypothetical protein O3G_MSEX014896 [Manduca sexta]|uniref:PiggyBac transposable element-derived protein domain-containing protein n=1 Tax=Manduca sexta TaxID=7130 RepID=A0A922D148_MANSE|nr:hypothetical protein O3G_MSEX014896 [Manduca sexta]
MEKENAFIDVNQPLAIANYNRNIGGVDILDQSVEYSRTFMKTKNELLSFIHFLDLAVADYWHKYKMDCTAATIHCGQVIDLLEFKLLVAEGLMCSLNRTKRIQADDEDNENRDVNCRSERYRPANPPLEPKRYSRYEHFPEFDEIVSPRSCRMDGCETRSTIRCGKCDV